MLGQAVAAAALITFKPGWSVLRPWQIWVITAPLGLFALVGLLQLARARRMTRIRLRLRAGQCLACGYDLRESPERCPECGREAREPTFTAR